MHFAKLLTFSINISNFHLCFLSMFFHWCFLFEYHIYAFDVCWCFSDQCIVGRCSVTDVCLFNRLVSCHKRGCGSKAVVQRLRVRLAHVQHWNLGEARWLELVDFFAWKWWRSNGHFHSRSWWEAWFRILFLIVLKEANLKWYPRSIASCSACSGNGSRSSSTGSSLTVSISITTPLISTNSSHCASLKFQYCGRICHAHKLWTTALEPHPPYLMIADKMIKQTLNITDKTLIAENSVIKHRRHKINLQKQNIEERKHRW